MENINTQVTDYLRQDIISGKFSRGERIVQEDLAERYGVSRMPIREALKRMEFEGLVKNEPRKGAVVFPISIDDIEEIYTLRLINESLAALKALPFVTANDIQRMEDILIEMESFNLSVETQEYYSDIHKEFHKLIIDKCPWRRLKQNVYIHWEHYIAIASPMILEKQFHKAQVEHRQIFEALSTKNHELLKNSIEYHTNRNKVDLIKVFQEKM